MRYVDHPVFEVFAEGDEHTQFPQYLTLRLEPTLRRRMPVPHLLLVVDVPVVVKGPTLWRGVKRP